MPERRNNRYSKFMENTRSKIENLFAKHAKILVYVLLAVLLLLILAIFILAAVQFFKEDYPEWNFSSGYGYLLLLYATIGLFVFYLKIFEPFYKEKFVNGTASFRTTVLEWYRRKWTPTIACIVLCCLMILFVGVIAIKNFKKLVSFVGIFTCFCFGLVFSKKPLAINPKQIFVSLYVAMFLGVICIYVPRELTLFHILEDRISIFVFHSFHAAEFVYGPLITVKNFTFTFSLLSSLFFIGFFVNILYYYGGFHKLIEMLGALVNWFVDTSVIEGVSAVMNVGFLNCEVMVALWPYLDSLTESEIHQVMASGFSGLSASLIFYISNSMRVKSHHLVVASAISAPATIFFSKLIRPETERSATTTTSLTRPKIDALNVFDSAFRGACYCIKLVIYIPACVCAYICIVYFLNEILNWLGILIGTEVVSFVWILKKLLWLPVLLMGVDADESEMAAEVLATRLVKSEFEAFLLLQDRADEGSISDRSENVITYAIAGAAGLPSVATVIATIYYLAPTKKILVLNTIFSAWLSGLIGCYISACIANLMV